MSCPIQPNGNVWPDHIFFSEKSCLPILLASWLLAVEVFPCYELTSDHMKKHNNHQLSL